jgi:hypothetical protein
MHSARFVILRSSFFFLLSAGGVLAAVLPALAQGDAFGSGSAWIDYDNDGDLDLLCLTPAGPVELFEYDLDLDTFTNRTSSAIPLDVRNRGRQSMGVACADFDNDGWTDAFVTYDGANVLLRNKGDGTFESLASGNGIKDSGGETVSSSVALIDYDNDNLLDVYIGNYYGHPNQLLHNLGNEGGALQFVDVAPELGLDIPAGEEDGDWTLGVAVADYDNDGDPDLYVANDYDGIGILELNPGPNRLYRNNGDGTFTDVSVESGAGDEGWAMGVSFGDYDNDGWLDIFVANFWEDALLQNQGDGTFVNQTERSRLTPQDWEYNGWGTGFIDFDNDGDLDLHVTNGYVPNGVGQIFNEPNQLWENRGISASTGHVLFVDISEKAGVGDVGDGRGASYADFNFDGFVDLMVINNQVFSGGEIIDSPKRLLYINRKDGTFEDQAKQYQIREEFLDAPKEQGWGSFSGNKWIQIKLVGDQMKTPIGARVKVTAGGRTQIKDFGASSYCSFNSPYLHFGLKTASTISEIEVRFPSGHVQKQNNVSPNQFLTITESPVPVRLTSFEIGTVPEGVRLAWTYRDDGDLAAFRVRRTVGGVTETVGHNLLGGGAMEFIDTTAPRGLQLDYTLEAHLRNGTRQQLRTATIRRDLPISATLGRSFPNPFQFSTSIPVQGDVGAGAAIQIFTISGRLVKTLPVTPGEGTVRWDGTGESGVAVSAGAYFYRLSGSAGAGTMKVIRRP